MRFSKSWRILLVRGLLGTAAFAAANALTYDSSGYFQREHEYHTEVSDFFARPEARALFAGDSHVAQLDNSLLADDAYNVAWGGDSLREVYAKLRYLIWRHAKLDTLFLTADAHMFGGGRLESSNRAYVDEYLLLTGSPYGLDRGRPAAALGTVPLFNDDFVQYLKKEISASFRRNKTRAVTEEKADAWVSLTDAQREAAALDTGHGDHAGIGEHPQPFMWFERIVALARGNGIHVVAVLYPAHAAYIDSVPPQADALVNAELARLGINDVLDFRHVFADPSYFADEDHLSRKGAVALLQLLSARCGRHLLAATPARDAPAAQAGAHE